MAVNATAIWRVRSSGSNTNGGGYDSAISGAGTDYSQQNAAQATGVNGTASGTATFTDTTAANFTSAMVGNALWIASGAGFTVGAYFIVTFNSATSVVLDRSPGTGTVAHWALGGGWADFWTNTTSSGPLVAGNTVFILGSGTPNPASYTYDYDATVAFTPATFNGSQVLFANDPSTPGYKAPPDTTGGMPVIKFDVGGFLFTNSAGVLSAAGLYFVGTTTAASWYVFQENNYSTTILGCVFDQFGFDAGFGFVNSYGLTALGCEVFSSVSAAAGFSTAFSSNNTNGVLMVSGCNIHDTIAGGVASANGVVCLVTVFNTIIAKCNGDGIKALGYQGSIIQNCTIDGNAGHGVNINIGNGNVVGVTVIGNIISNHTTAGKFGFTANGPNKGGLVDYNSYYNNTSNYNNQPAGPHDTALGVTPYVASATENYALA